MKNSLPPGYKERYFAFCQRITAEERDYIKDLAKKNNTTRQALFSAIIYKMMSESDWLPLDVLDFAKAETEEVNRISFLKISRARENEARQRDAGRF